MHHFLFWLCLTFVLTICEQFFWLFVDSKACCQIVTGQDGTFIYSCNTYNFLRLEIPAAVPDELTDVLRTLVSGHLRHL